MPNRVPTIQGVTAMPTTVDDATPATLTVMASDPDGDALTFTWTRGSGTTGTVTFTPNGTTAGSTVVTVAGVPRGMLVLNVSAADGRGGTATSTVTLMVANHAPVADAGVPAQVMPDSPGSVTLMGTFTDADTGAGDTHTFAWALATGTTPGITLVNANTQNVTVQVDRSEYQPDLADFHDTVTLTFTVTDDTGAASTDSVTVTILDERGPYVDNTSPYSGTGLPEGYCGARAHPCNNLDDAVINLRGAVDAMSGHDPQILVATTGTDHTRTTTLLVDNGLSITCGFDPVTWMPTVPFVRTPIRTVFNVDATEADGIRMTSPGTIRGCDIQVAVDAAAEVPVVRAVHAVGTGITVDNCRVAGNTGSALGAVGFTSGVTLTTLDATSTFTVSGSEVLGGVANTTSAGITTTVSAGIVASGGVPVIRDNTRVAGGQGGFSVGMELQVATAAAGEPTALVSNNVVDGGVGGSASGNASIGINVARGNPRIRGNTVTGGASPLTAVAARVDAGATNPLFESNTLTGTNPGVGGIQAGAGVAAEGSATLMMNTIRGGTATLALGVVVSNAAGSGVVTLSGDTVVGGQGNVVTGLDASAGAVVQGTNVVVNAFDGLLAPLGDITGVHAAGSSVTLTGGSVSTGSGTSMVRGIHAEGGNRLVSLDGVAVTAGSSSARESHGASILSGTFSMRGGSLAAGRAPGVNGVSTGLHLNGADLFTVEPDAAGAGPVITSAGATTQSLGIHAVAMAASTTANTIRGATVTSASATTSVGIQLNNAALVTLADNTVTSGTGTTTLGLRSSGTTVTSAGDEFTAGDAASTCAGAGLQGGAFTGTDATATGCMVASSSPGIATPSSAGLALTNVNNASITGGVFTGGAVDGAPTGYSAGLVLNAVGGAVTGVSITNATATGGSASAGSSSGLRVMGGASNSTTVTGGTFTGGAAADSAGALVMMGITESRFLRGTYQGGAGSNRSRGMRFEGVGAGTIIMGNRIHAGVTGDAGQSVGFDIQARQPLGLGNVMAVASNVITGAAAPTSMGILAAGGAAGTLRFLNNTVDALGDSGGTSTAVFLGVLGAGLNTTAHFVGNILVPGVGMTRHGYFEECRLVGTTASRATVDRAGNTDFMPGTGNIHVRRSTIGGGGCMAQAITDITVVNTTGPYAAFGGSTSYDVDPLLTADYHTGEAFLQEKSAETTLQWPAAFGLMRDIDNALRPLGVRYDIGADEF